MYWTELNMYLLDGNSEIGVHLWSEFDNLICFRYWWRVFAIHFKCPAGWRPDKRYPVFDIRLLLTWKRNMKYYNLITFFWLRIKKACRLRMENSKRSDCSDTPFFISFTHIRPCSFWVKISSKIKPLNTTYSYILKITYMAVG